MKYIVILILFNSSLFARYSFTFKKITTDDGLSNSTVNSISQDENGYIWFGTLNGLNKYDGYNFKKFKYRKGVVNSISGNRVYSLFSNNNHLWIGLFDGGLNSIELNTLKIKKYKFNSNSMSNGKHIRNLFKDSKGFLWISTDGGLKRINLKTNKLKQYLHSDLNKNSISTNYIRMVFEDNDNNLWIAGKGNGILNKFDYKNNSFIKIDFKIRGSNVEWITQDNNNNLYIGTRDGPLNIVNLKNSTIKYLYFRKENGNISKESLIRRLFFEKETNLLWIGTEKGLYIYNVNDAKFEVVNGLKKIHVRTIFKDLMGMIWIGTLSNGVIKINKNDLSVKFLLHNKKNPNSLVDNVVWGIYEDNFRNLFISTTNGLTLYDEKNNFIRKYIHKIHDRFSISESNVTSIIQINDDKYWMGTYGEGVLVFNKKEQKFSNINEDFKNIMGVTSNYISKLFKDNNNNIWIGSYNNGLSIYLKDEKKIKKENIKSKQIRDIIEDDKHNIWIATYGDGLFLYKNKKFKNFLKKFKNKIFLIDNSIYAIAYDKKNNFIWAATESGYLIFDLSKKKFIEFDFLKPLNNNILVGVVIDKNNDIWFSSKKGIFRVDFKNKKMFLFDKKDGLLTDEFNEKAFFIKKDNTLCFGSKKGVLLLIPKKIKINNKKPIIGVTSIKINGKLFNNFKKSFLRTKEILLNYNNNLIEFHFFLLDYLDTSKNMYQYKIIGINKNWSDFTSNNELVFTGLKPGTYKLIVRGKNSKQVISKNNIKIVILVLPPFYHRVSFIIFVVLLIAISIFLIIKFRIKNIKTMNKLLKERVDEKTKELYVINEKLRKMALSDSLTSLKNRYYFKVVLKEQIDNFIKNKLSILNNPKRQNDENNDNVIGLFMVDLDHFKFVNDKYGHDSGDMVLTQLADVFRGTTRGSDAIIRWGGEEFLIILKDCKVEYLDIYCEKLLKEVSRYDFKVLSGEKTIKKTCSIGYVKYPVLNDDIDYINLEIAIIIADLALYYAKENGRNKGVNLGISSFKPNPENISEYIEDIEKSFKNNFLKINKIIEGEKND